MGKSQSKAFPEEEIDDGRSEVMGSTTPTAEGDSYEEDEEFMDAEDGSGSEEGADTDTDSSSRFLTARSDYEAPSEVPESLCVNYNADNKSSCQGEPAGAPLRPPRTTSIADMNDFEWCEYNLGSSGNLPFPI